MDQRSAGFVYKGPEVNVFIFEAHRVYATITQLFVSGKAGEACTDEWPWLSSVNIIYIMGGCLDLACGHGFADPGIKDKSSSNRVLFTCEWNMVQGHFESQRPDHSG